MGQPYVGEIRMFGGNFAPAGWMFCEGQLLSIAEYEVLFNVIGISYGGDGESTFGLPDLRGRIPIHQGNGFACTDQGGAEQLTLTVQQIPVHSHPLLAATGTGGPNPAGSILATSTAVDVYRESAAGTAMAPASVTPVGGSQPHTNFQPYLCVSFIIAMFGIFPQQT
jgi:microcystin-dependent protein